MSGEVCPRASTNYALEPQQRGELCEMRAAVQNHERFFMFTQASLTPAFLKYVLQRILCTEAANNRI